MVGVTRIVIPTMVEALLSAAEPLVNPSDQGTSLMTPVVES